MAGLIDLYNSVNTTLTADQSAGSFYDDVSGAIYLVDGPANADVPLCIITPIDEALGGNFSASEDDAEFVFQIDLYAAHKTTTPEALLAINDKLIALLDRQDITIANWSCATAYADGTRGTLTRDGDVWVCNSQWIIIASE